LRHEWFLSDMHSAHAHKFILSANHRFNALAPIASQHFCDSSPLPGRATAQHAIACTEDILEQNLLKEVEECVATVDNSDCAIWLDDC
jgi:hypothetical protein